MIPAFPTDERPLQDVQSRPADRRWISIGGLTSFRLPLGGARPRPGPPAYVATVDMGVTCPPPSKART